ncbi:hypothetical protein A1L58_11745 [Shewanella baltica]|uniref:tetratricopeptide repeat protein n=1 Tax=Shewanella baltica TaxID=62322 RepID=UPI0007B47C07|nr:tetratricopeptide repeat protein [Shewanella baltica]KZK70918.1 hypothetical protein A1L58_11745 [Shewanella baltica]
MSAIGTMYASAVGVEKDQTRALAWFLKAAEQGSDIAEKIVGDTYNFGYGVPIDWSKAHFWYLKSARQGNLEAQKALGFLYVLGQGTEQDFKNGYAWFSIAATGGDVESINYRDETAKNLSTQQLNEAQQLSSKLYEELSNSR